MDFKEVLNLVPSSVATCLAKCGEEVHSYVMCSVKRLHARLHAKIVSNSVYTPGALRLWEGCLVGSHSIGVIQESVENSTLVHYVIRLCW